MGRGRVKGRGGREEACLTVTHVLNGASIVADGSAVSHRFPTFSGASSHLRLASGLAVSTTRAWPPRRLQPQTSRILYQQLFSDSQMVEYKVINASIDFVRPTPTKTDCGHCNERSTAIPLPTFISVPEEPRHPRDGRGALSESYPMCKKQVAQSVVRLNSFTGGNLSA